MAQAVTIDVRRTIRDVKRQMGYIQRKDLRKALSRALNHTAAKAKTQSSREIRKVYNLKSKDIKSTIAIRKASFSTLEAHVTSTGRPLPIKAFKGVRQNRRGVSVQIKKTSRRKTIRSAFIASMSNGHVGVFIRGRYSGSSVQYLKPRLPIQELYSSSVPHAFSNNVVMQSLQQGVDKNLSTRLLHELKRLPV